ncbi:uncharacterized protein LOC134540745 [Bacillus rossius redtenbacheri]|uniref:uncharacterized protein LOC134540745 n=1 Tax=Bacillus rossius redtenbacheri TaxID=93214 RepID=UPI002FDECA1F
MTKQAPLTALLLASALVPWTTLADASLAGVSHLTAEPDFREVTLRWESDGRAIPQLRGFEVHYCELLAWGPTRCRAKTVDAGSGRDVVSEDRKARAYAAVVGDLRLATNYSFEVRPLARRGGWQSEPQQDKALSKALVVATKGFSAKATQCLPRASEVEVLTGPHFGGRIAVEASGGDERCAVDGDPRSARDTYLLRIDHEACGAHVNETAVAAFVLVQESLTILTHSTRRFLVLCTFQPETLTVRAGINMPGARRRPELDGNQLGPDDAAPPFDGDLESANDVQVSRLQRHQQVVELPLSYVSRDQSTAQVVVMTFLVIAVVMGCVAAAWWFVPGVHSHLAARRAAAYDPASPASSTYENFQNSLRDSPCCSELVLDAASLEAGDFEGGGGCLAECANANVVVVGGGGPCVTLERASQSEA